MCSTGRVQAIALALAFLLALSTSFAGIVRAQGGPSEPGTYLVEVSTGRLVRLGENALASWSPDGKYLAVADTRGDPVEARLRLFSVPLPASGTGPERTVDLGERGTIDQLRWSPDGSRLAFTKSRFGRDAGPSLAVVDPVAGTAREIVRGSVGEFTWTPDSRSIAAVTFSGAGNDAGSIVTLSAMTGDVQQTILAGNDATCQRGLAWSPDGKHLAYAGPGLREGCGEVGNWGIWTWDSTTKMASHLFTGASDAPQWLANGTLVAMVSMPRAEAVPRLTILRYESVGSEPRPVAEDIPRMFPQPMRLIQTAGSTLMYVIGTCDDSAAYIWNPDLTAPRRQTPEDVYAFGPALAADGRQLAYVRIGESKAELVVAPISGGDPRVILTTTDLGLQVGTQGPWGAAGEWSPDGTWLAVEVTSEQYRDCVN